MSSLDGRRLRCAPFLIVFPLIPCRLPGANDSYDVLSLNEADQQQAVPRRVPDDNLASLADGEIFVVEDPRQRVAKYTDRLLGRYACRLRFDPLSSGPTRIAPPFPHRKRSTAASGFDGVTTANSEAINAHDEQRAKRGCSIVKLAVSRQSAAVSLRAREA